MRKLILILIIILSFASLSYADKYSHIKLAHYHLNEAVPLSDPDQTFMGQNFDLLVLGGVPVHDLSALYTANPNVKVYAYISGNGIYRWADEALTTRTTNYDAILSWCVANSKDYEQLFLHYRTDKTFGAGEPLSAHDWSDAPLVAGFANGVVPGYGAGTATYRAESRVWGSPTFLDNNSRTLTVSASSGAVRASNVVTITTTAVHKLDIDDKVTISSVDDATFNGSFIIASIPTTTTFTYAQTAANATSQNGSVVYYGMRAWYINYKNTEYSDYFGDQMTTLCEDSTSRKVDGYYFDSMTNQLTYNTQMGWDSTQEYIDDGASDIEDWLTAKIKTWVDRLRVKTTAFLAGTGKTSYVAVNGDHINYVGDVTNQYHAVYETAGSGPDIVIIEDCITPAVLSGPTASEIKLKHLFDLEETYQKRLIWEAKTYTTIPYDVGNVILTWVNYSGNIWYTTGFNNSICLVNISVSGGSAAGYSLGGAAHGIAANLGAMTHGQLYFDSATGRQYAWFHDNDDPTGQVIMACGGDKLHHFGLAVYYCFGRLGDYGYYFPFYTGYTYNITPSATDYRGWHPSVVYNIGQPALGGVKYDGTTPNDVWGVSLATSSRAFEFWRGNASTGEAGLWASDWGTSLSSSHRVYARKFSNAYTFFRMRISTTNSITDGSYTQPVTFTLPFNGRVLKADNTLGPVTNQITIRQAEGVVLIVGDSSLAIGSGTQSISIGGGSSTINW